MRTTCLSFALALSIAALAPMPSSAQQSPPVRINDSMAPLSAQLPDAARLAQFDAYVARVQKQFNVPGVAVAIVADGKVVMERGYGVREMGKPAPVDAHTLFAIASNTKAFTSASLNMLQDDGKLKTTDRVIDHLPWFRMSDHYVTHEMRVRDLLAHRSGLSLGAGDLLYWPTTTYSTREVAERLKDVPLTGGFREQYAYDNILFGVAELVIEQASGVSYKQFLQTRIWNPLGMSETRFNSDDLKPGDNVAVGNALYDFKDLRPVGVTSWRNVSGRAVGRRCLCRHRRQRQAIVFRTAPARDVDNAHANSGAAIVDSRLGRCHSEFLWLRAGLEPVGLPRQPDGLAHRRLAGSGVAGDVVAGQAFRRGSAHQR